MKRLLAGLGVGLLLCVVTGCGTIANTVQGKNYVYGGVGADLTVVGDALKDQDATFANRSSSVVMATADIPFSFVADTLLMPINAMSEPKQSANIPTPGLSQ